PGSKPSSSRTTGTSTSPRTLKINQRRVGQTGRSSSAYRDLTRRGEARDERASPHRRHLVRDRGDAEEVIVPACAQQLALRRAGSAAHDDRVAEGRRGGCLGQV